MNPITKSMEIVQYHELMKQTETIDPTACIPIATYNAHISHMRKLCQLQARAMREHVKSEHQMVGA